MGNKKVEDRSGNQKELSKKRSYLPEVDLLKAFAALLVILIHVTARYKNDSNAMFLFWDYIHFAVGSFVLASGYLFQNSLPQISNVKEFGIYLWKKFKRIVIPYYIFAIIFSIAVFLFGVKDLSNIANVRYIFETIFLFGGVGNNWIPLLFMGIMFIEGIEVWVYPRFKQITLIFFSIAVAISIYQMTRDTEFLRMFDRIFGWLVVFYVGRFLYGRVDIKTILKIWIPSLIIFLLLNNVFGMMGIDRGIFANKYPPNFYYVTYQLIAVLPIFYIIKKYGHIIESRKKLWSVIMFIAVTSYEIFFYHLLVMESWKREINWFVDWVIISAATIGGLYLFNYLKKKILRKEKKS